jgi:hypothetical protein
VSAVLPQNVLVRLGGRTLQRYGVPYLRRAPAARGGELGKVTWTRADASTAASYITAQQLLAKAAANVPRVDYSNVYNTDPHLLAEPNVTNRCLWSEAFSGNWTLEAGEALTIGQADPFAGTAATLMTKTGTTTEGRMSLISALAAFTVCPISLFIKQGTSAAGYFGIFDNTAALWRGQIVWTWTGGVPVLAAGTGGGLVGQVIALSGGWYRITGVLSGIVSGNSNAMFISPVVGIANTGTVMVIGAQEEDGTYGFPTSYIKTAGAAVARAADSWSLPFYWPPQDLTLYAAFDTLFARNYASQSLGTFPLLARVGGTSVTSARLYLVGSNNPGQGGTILVGDGDANVNFNEATFALPPSGLVEVTAQFRASDGGLNVALGAGAFGGFYTSGRTVFANSWSNFVLGATDGTAAYRYRDLIVTQGLHSYAEMTAIPQN